MRKRFAPLALLFGLLTALMLGSTSAAQATPILDIDNNGCTSGVVNLNIITCSDTLNNVKVVIVNSGANVDLTALKNSLNSNNIPINVLNIILAKNSVANVYNNQVNPDITVGNIVICVGSVCY